MQPLAAPSFGRRTDRARARIPGWVSAGAGAFLCSTVAWAYAPQPGQARSDGHRQWQALGIAPLASGGATGMRMVASSAVEPVEFVPARPRPAPGPVAAPPPPPAEAGPLRVRGQVGDGFYWSLRAAGASPQAAAQYLAALATEIDVGEVASGDRFDFILGGRGPNAQLLYAGIDRTAASDLQLVRWTASGRAQWINAASVDQPLSASPGMAWPVAGRITSHFGYRTHPILRFKRFHSGVDFGAGWGAPIVAAADGQVVRAGWAGGYGRQVRIAHGGGTVTSYSHMSSIVAHAGGFVSAGQLIGYVGSSGLSTGPHLHYEVHQDGAPVNPLGVRFASRQVVDRGFADAVKARLKALMQVGVKRG